jgi:non-ribosomal peptide synthase protein (TIGR01720 family)
LPEIENRLLKCNDIKKAVVLAKEDNSKNRYLCAYYVSDAKISAAELRADMLKYLPHYMVPSYFVEIGDIPLTLNGKIDRKALPAPGEKTAETYIAPGNKIEEKLVEVWQNVLGRERIGINENFFTIGGDSIKSIQIAARMNKAGFKVEMRDIFRNPSISQLAPLVKITSRFADQSVICGIVPLTPIQEDYFRFHRIDPHHYNQSVMLYSAEGFDQAAVKAVFIKIQGHHDALRMTYKQEGGEIIQTNRGLDHPFSLEIYDFGGRKNALEMLEEKADMIQSTISLEKGPLMKTGLFHLDDGDRLLIVIHHLVIDTVSWRILFEDIETLYRQHKKGEPLALPLKTDSFMTWSKKLSRYADSEEFLKEKAYWAKLESLVVPPIKKDFAQGDNHLEDAAGLSFSLGKEETGQLLTTVNVPFGTDINDILLTALGLAIKGTFESNPVLIALEGHGREEIIKDIDITRTVGWFTSVYPVLLDISYADDLSRQIKEIKESLLQVPHKGIGYGILEYLTAGEYKREIDFKLAPQISFNYLGQFDTDVEQMSSFKIARESTGKRLGNKGQRRHSFDVSGLISDKQLSLSIVYNKKQYKAETVKTLMDHYMTELKRIISYCSAREKRELTPGDLTYGKLSIDTLDRIAGSIQGKIEDIYPLTPIQEGMLFHSLYDSSSSAYYQQMSYRLRGDLDITLVKKSLNELFKRYDILRTIFVHENVDRPLQVVLEEREVEFYYEDLSKTMAGRDKEKFIREFKEKDKRRSFDLSEDVLMRAAFLRLGISEYELTWSYHHILMDRWCFGIFISDFFEVYNRYLENKPYKLPGTQPFRRYIEWLERQDKKESVSFWQKYLVGYNRAVGIPRTISREKSGNKYDKRHVIRELAKGKTGALVELAARHSTTLTAVFQAVWGILLAKYNGQRNADVVYGLVVSGRPPGLAGVESMMGLFINTIPVRIRYEEKTTFKDLLLRIREQAVESMPYHYSPLAEIQAGSPLKQDLIDHVLVFENLPLPQQIDGLMAKNKGNNRGVILEVSNVETVEQGNYDLEVIISGTSTPF